MRLPMKAYLIAHLHSRRLLAISFYIFNALRTFTQRSTLLAIQNTGYPSIDYKAVLLRL